jgi:hypothetical protein
MYLWPMIKVASTGVLACQATQGSTLGKPFSFHTQHPPGRCFPEYTAAQSRRKRLEQGRKEQSAQINRGTVIRGAVLWQVTSGENHTDSLSPLRWVSQSAFLIDVVESLPPKHPHVNPPPPFFKVPRAEWPRVVQRIAQGESLRKARTQLSGVLRGHPAHSGHGAEEPGA